MMPHWFSIPGFQVRQKLKFGGEIQKVSRNVEFFAKLSNNDFDLQDGSKFYIGTKKATEVSPFSTSNVVRSCPRKLSKSFPRMPQPTNVIFLIL